MRNGTQGVSIIGGADGPTSVFILKKNSKLMLRQKIERLKNRIKRALVARTIKADSHSLDDVMEYLVNVHGFVELSNDSREVIEEYDQIRAAFLLQHASELLGEYAILPELKSHDPESVKLYLKQCEERLQKATEIPTTEFDVDFHKFKKTFDNVNDNIHIVIEKKFGYIGGGAVGNKKVMKIFSRIYKDVYRYYGVTEEDIKSESERYKDLVRTLSR